MEQGNVFSIRLMERLRGILIARIGFWCNRLFDLELRQGAIQLNLFGDDSRAKKVIIVAREHYFESVQDYPIGDVNDLKLVLKHEHWSFPYQGLRFFSIERLSDQSHRVTNWVVKSDFLNKIKNRPWFLVPETACIAVISGSKPSTTSRLDKKVDVMVGADGLGSSVYSDEDESAGANNGKKFKELIGVGSDSWQVLTEVETLEMMLAGLRRVILKDPLRFFLRPKFSFIRAYPWPKASRLGAALLTCYITIVSMYLWSSSQWIDYRIDHLTSEAELALNSRQKLLGSRQLMQQLSEPLASIAPSWIAWDVFLDLSAEGVAVTSITGSGAEVTFYALAERASDVLAMLTEDSRIASAEYATPVLQLGSNQQFAVKTVFVLTDGHDVLSKSSSSSPLTNGTSREKETLDTAESDLGVRDES